MTDKVLVDKAAADRAAADDAVDGAPEADPGIEAAWPLDHGLDEAALLGFLAELGIAPVVHRHRPVFTVAESQDVCAGLTDGVHVKNMFLKDKKGGLWLVTCLEDRRIRIKDLETALGAPKMSFGKPELLGEALAVRPGAVTPLAAVNDATARRVTVVLDQALDAAETVYCHPLHNAATVGLTPAELARFFEATGHAPVRVDFDALEAAAAAQ